MGPLQRTLLAQHHNLAGHMQRLINPMDRINRAKGALKRTRTGVSLRFQTINIPRKHGRQFDVWYTC
jgi:hypothetical protein